MAVRKFNLNKEYYDIVKAFIDEVGFPYPQLNHDTMLKMHELSTMLGTPSSPGSCPTCNRKAYTTLTSYIYQYENQNEE